MMRCCRKSSGFGCRNEKRFEAPKSACAFLKSVCPGDRDINNSLVQIEATKQALMGTLATPRETSRESSRRPGVDRCRTVRDRCGGDAALLERLLEQDAR